MAKEKNKAVNEKKKRQKRSAESADQDWSPGPSQQDDINEQKQEEAKKETTPAVDNTAADQGKP